MRPIDITRFNIQRKIVASQTVDSWQNIPHVSYIFEPDLTEFFDKYKEFNASLPDDKHVTLNTVIIKAICEALKEAPEMNAHIHYESKLVRGKITTFDNIDISMPWILPNGEMMTINMRDMGRRSLSNITEYMKEVSKKLEKTNLTEAMYSVSIDNTLENLKQGRVLKSLLRLYGSKTNPRHRVSPLKGEAKKAYDTIPDSEKITKHDIEPGTITISNVGSLIRDNPGEMAMLMIIPPQVCAIGIGGLQKRPVVVTNEDGEDEIKVARILPMCVVFDHRAMDFGNIRPFLDKLREIFNNPEMILKLD